MKEQPSSAPFFATLAFTFMVGLIAVSWTSTKQISQLKYESLIDNKTINSLTNETHELKSRSHYFESLLKESKGSNDTMIADLMNYKSQIEKMKAEIEEYESVQLQSNEVLKKLMLN